MSLSVSMINAHVQNELSIKHASPQTRNRFLVKCLKREASAFRQIREGKVSPLLYSIVAIGKS